MYACLRPHLHARARLAGVGVAGVVHDADLVEGAAAQVDPLEERAHRAAKSATVCVQAATLCIPGRRVPNRAATPAALGCTPCCVGLLPQVRGAGGWRCKVGAWGRGPVLGHHAEVGIAARARILLESIGQVELPVLRRAPQRLQLAVHLGVGEHLRMDARCGEHRSRSGGADWARRGSA